MRPSSTLASALLLGLAATASIALAQPVTGPEAAQQTRAFDQLQQTLAAETTDAARFTHIARVMNDEPDANQRRRILDIAAQFPGPDLEQFLTGVLSHDQDAGLRSQAATTLGLKGSQKSLPILAHAARNDPTTPMTIGDIGTQSSARRAATFAIAELASRFPKLAGDAVAKLRALPQVQAAPENESLTDARAQAIYQITHENELLKPFYERLKSKDAAERQRGVVAFRFLKLKQAPLEIVNTLKDADTDVRSWSALVLGEIGDPKTAPNLIAAATDAREDNSVRCNAIQALGHIKTAESTESIERLLKDANPSVQANAAIALYRLTGKKVEQFPSGYSAD
jgi:HEAT repeat protein